MHKQEGHIKLKNTLYVLVGLAQIRALIRWGPDAVKSIRLPAGSANTDVNPR